MRSLTEDEAAAIAERTVIARDQVKVTTWTAERQGDKGNRVELSDECVAEFWGNPKNA